MSAPEQGGLSEVEREAWRVRLAETLRDIGPQPGGVLEPDRISAKLMDSEWFAEVVNRRGSEVAHEDPARLAAVPAAEAGLRAAVEGLADLSAAATPGPWRQEFYRDGELLPDGTGGLDDYETPGSGVYVIDQTSDDGYCLTEFDAGRAPDAAFIVAAVNLVRSLLAGRGDV